MAEMKPTFNGYSSAVIKILHLWITFCCIQVSNHLTRILFDHHRHHHHGRLKMSSAFLIKFKYLHLQIKKIR